MTIEGFILLESGVWKVLNNPSVLKRLLLKYGYSSRLERGTS